MRRPAPILARTPRYSRRTLVVDVQPAPNGQGVVIRPTLVDANGVVRWVGEPAPVIAGDEYRIRGLYGRDLDA